MNIFPQGFKDNGLWPTIWSNGKYGRWEVIQIVWLLSIINKLNYSTTNSSVLYSLAQERFCVKTRIFNNIRENNLTAHKKNP